MAWLQVILSTDATSAEIISDVIAEYGALAVTLHDGGQMALFEQELYATPLWDETVVVGLFEDTLDKNNLLADLKIHLANFTYHDLRVETLADMDWERAWMDRFQPMQFGGRLWICPSWLEVPEPGAVTVKIDPGLAFGTGTHATTAMMLEWLAHADLQGKRVIDYGTGSGILAIAAAKLGASTVWAVDNDPRALLVTQENSQKNALSPSQLMTHLPDTLPVVAVDILIANILAEPLKGLAETFATLVQSQGVLLLSGILSHQAEAVCAAYAPWFDCRVGAQREEWVRLDAIRK